MELARAEALAHWVLGHWGIRHQASTFHGVVQPVLVGEWRLPLPSVSTGSTPTHAHNGPRARWSGRSAAGAAGPCQPVPLCALWAIPSGKPADPFFA